MKKFLIIFGIVIATIFGVSTETFAESIPWQNPKMLYTYIPPDKYSDLMKEAFAYWSKITNNKIVFKYVSDPSKALIKVTFVKDAVKATSIEHSLGVTYSKYKIVYNDKGVGKLYRKNANICIASNKPGGGLMLKDAIYRVMVHEIGHAIGLEHSQDRTSIMYYAKGGYNTTIKPEDLAAVNKLYGW